MTCKDFEPESSFGQGPPERAFQAENKSSRPQGSEDSARLLEAAFQPNSMHTRISTEQIVFSVPLCSVVNTLRSPPAALTL